MGDLSSHKEYKRSKDRQLQLNRQNKDNSDTEQDSPDDELDDNYINETDVTGLDPATKKVFPDPDDTMPDRGTWYLASEYYRHMD